MLKVEAFQSVYEEASVRGLRSSGCVRNLNIRFSRDLIFHMLFLDSEMIALVQLMGASEPKTHSLHTGVIYEMLAVVLFQPGP